MPMLLKNYFIKALLFCCVLPSVSFSARVQCSYFLEPVAKRPSVDRLPKGFWSENTLRSVLKTLHQAGVKTLFLEELSRNDLSEVEPILRNKFGYYFHGKSIENYVRKHQKYPFWARELGALGLPRTPGQLTRLRIKKVLIAREKQGLNNEQKEAERDHSDEFKEILRFHFGKDITPWAFYHKLHYFFGGFDKALNAAMLYERTGLDEEPFIQSMQRLVEHFGAEVTEVRSFLRLKMTDMNLIQDLFPKPISSKKFLRLFNEAFGGWERGLNVAGVEVLAKRVKWSRYKLKRTIELLRRHYSDAQMSYAFIQGLSREDLRFLKPFLKADVSGQALLVKYDRSGGWYAALEKEGVDLTKVREEARISKTNLIKVIKEIARMVNPSSSTVDKLKSTDLEHLTSYMGRPTSGRSIREIAARAFGSWDQALVATGLNPDEVRLRGWAKYEVISYAAQVERARIHDREQSIMGLKGVEVTGDEFEVVSVDTHSLDDELAKKKFDETFLNFTESMKEREAAVFEYLLKAAEDLSGETEEFSLSLAIEKIKEYDSTVTNEEVQKLVLGISKNEELLAAFMEYVQDF